MCALANNPQLPDTWQEKRLSVIEASRARLEAGDAGLEAILHRRTAFLREAIPAGARVLAVGDGIGVTARYLPQARVFDSDIVPWPWLGAAVDAMRIPFRDRCFDAVVGLHVLHHLPFPARGMHEMIRVLRPGGRLFIADAHVSLLLRLVLALSRHEIIDWNVDPLGAATCQPNPGAAGVGNNAIADLMFGDRERFRRTFPQLELERHRYTECLFLLNSGGVGYRAPRLPVPAFLEPAMGALDRLLLAMPSIFPICQEFTFRRKA